MASGNLRVLKFFCAHRKQTKVKGSTQLYNVYLNARLVKRKRLSVTLRNPERFVNKGNDDACGKFQPQNTQEGH